ncbi:MAG TPA: hypothetical protein DCR20_09410 [Planctomycetaceae bacterium]|nr:hypothetical protein [Planctomycetaceae bacterium]
MLIWIAPSSGWTARILAEICFRSNEFRVSSENGILRIEELVPCHDPRIQVFAKVFRRCISGNRESLARKLKPI